MNHNNRPNVISRPSIVSPNSAGIGSLTTCPLPGATSMESFAKFLRSASVNTTLRVGGINSSLSPTRKRFFTSTTRSVPSRVTVHGIQSTTPVLRAALHVLYPMFCFYSSAMHSPAPFHRLSHWQGNVRQGNDRVRDTVRRFRSSYHHLERCSQKRHTCSRLPPSFCGSLLVSWSKSRERLRMSLRQPSEIVPGASSCHWPAISPSITTRKDSKSRYLLSGSCVTLERSYLAWFLF